MQIDVLCIGHAAYDLGVFLDHSPLEKTKSETPDLPGMGGGPGAPSASLLSSWGTPTLNRVEKTLANAD
ncbi:MAG: hypothetical protein P4L99_24750 [Chthoniobacter sp.]|nr:hypothetical protein [Chthoniobacter sp.]